MNFYQYVLFLKLEAIWFKLTFAILLLLWHIKTTLKLSFLGDDLLEFHQAVVSTLRDADDIPIPLDPAPHIPHTHSTHSGMLPPMNDDLGRISDTINTDQDPEDDMDPGVWLSGKLMISAVVKDFQDLFLSNTNVV